MVAEYDGSGALTKRYVPGLGLDDVAVSYDGAGTSNRSWLLADERGSVVGLSGLTGAVTNINRYDEYGVPASTNSGRFQYTGQPWLAEAGAYHYRSRAYLPEVGRFLQSDPIMYAAGANVYNYVGSDPVNLKDPMGLFPRFGSDREFCTYHSVALPANPTTGEIVVELRVTSCITLGELDRWFDEQRYIHFVQPFEEFSQRQCAMTRPQSASPIDDPTANARDAMEELSAMTARVQNGNVSGIAADMWAKGLGNINQAMSAAGALGVAITQVDDGVSPIVAAAGVVGRFGSTVAVAEGTAVVVGGVTSAIVGPEAGVPIGSVASTMATTAWIGSGAAEAAGGLAEDSALYALGCNE